MFVPHQEFGPDPPHSLLQAVLILTSVVVVVERAAAAVTEAESVVREESKVVPFSPLTMLSVITKSKHEITIVALHVICFKFLQIRPVSPAHPLSLLSMQNYSSRS